MATIQYRFTARFRHAGELPEVANFTEWEILPLDVFGEEDRVVNELAMRQALLKTGVSNRAKRARFMLYLYYWQGLTLEEIGQEFDLSRERVRQILDWILAKLARILEP